MLALGYVGTASLFSLAGVFALRSRNIRSYGNGLSKGLDADLSKINDQTTYVALQFFFTAPLPPSPYFPSHKPVYYRRIQVEEAKSIIDTGIGFVLDKKNDPVVMNTYRVLHSNNQFGEPTQPTLMSQLGPVIVNNLDLAKMKGGTEPRVYHMSAEKAAPLLRKLGLVPDFKANYKFTVDEIAHNPVTIFGKVSKNGDMCYMNAPDDDAPHISTPVPPKDYVAWVMSEADSNKQDAKVYGLAGAVLGSATMGLSSVKATFADVVEFKLPFRPIRGMQIFATSAALALSLVAFRKVWKSGKESE